MTRPIICLLGLGAALVALTLGALALDVPASYGGDEYLPRMNLLVGLMMVSALVYFAGAWVVLRRPLPNRALWLVLGVAVVLRAVLWVTPPFLSTDIFRYVWDGRVQAAGINPYRYLPVDPALAPLRDKEVYPLINRPEYARTIYPPAAQLVFALVGRTWASVLGMKLAMLGFEALGVLCLLRLLFLAGLPSARILIYAWNPLLFWSFAADGHVDAVVVGLLGLALLLRARRRDGWAGIFLGCAALVKFFPVAVAPAFVRGGRFWRPALAGAATIVALYALYSSAGRDVLGFLPSYQTEEGLAAGTGFWLLAALGRVAALPAAAVPVYLACAAAVLAWLALVIARSAPGGGSGIVTLCRDVSVLATAATVAISPHYPWYFAWLAVPAVVAPSRTVLWLSTVPLLLYLDPWPHDHFAFPTLVYLPALGLLAAGLWPRRAGALSSGAGAEEEPSRPLRQR